MILVLLACSGADTDRPGSDLTAGIVVATTDFSVGALAVVDPDAMTVHDALATVSGDPLVAAADGWIVQLNRSASTSIRLYAPGEWTAPAVEIAPGAGTNPQSAAICDGRLFVSLLSTDRIGVWELDGTPAGAVDLSAFADEDGSPEPASLVRVGDRLFVAMNELTTTGSTWRPSGPGRVAEVDCATNAVVRSWATGPDPSIVASAAGGLLVRTGIWGEADGAIGTLDVDRDGEVQELVTEAALDLDVGDLVATPTGAVIVGAAFDWSTNVVGCLDLASGELTTMTSTPSFAADVVLDASGRAWVALSTDYADPGTPVGLRAYDPGACTEVTGELLATTLPPYSLAVFGP